MSHDTTGLTYISWRGLLPSAGVAFDEVLRLRRRAWEAGARPRPPTVEFDSPGPHDLHGEHVGAVDGAGVLRAAARVCVHDACEELPDFPILPVESAARRFEYPLASLNRLVVDPAFQGRGIVTQLVRRRLQLAASLGARAVMACVRAAHTGNVSPWEKLGMSVVEEFESVWHTHTHTHTRAYCIAPSIAFDGGWSSPADEVRALTDRVRGLGDRHVNLRSIQSKGAARRNMKARHDS